MKPHPFTKLRRLVLGKPEALRLAQEKRAFEKYLRFEKGYSRAAAVAEVAQKYRERG